MTALRPGLAVHPRLCDRHGSDSLSVGNPAPWQPRDAPLVFIAAGDPVDFGDDRARDSEPSSDGSPAWVVLIVDDDRGVHDATLLALHGEHIAGRPLAFRHAYSAAEARRMLGEDKTIGIVLLDVVMESADAGLRLVADLRGALGRADLKIIVRTGQPGRAPEAAVRSDLAIDGYLTKATQTRAMLLEALAHALQPDKTSSDGAQH